MPYFVYRIAPEKRLEHIDTFEKYRDAKLCLRELYKTEDDNSESVCRMMFAETMSKAEQLLLAPRDDRMIGDD